MSWPSRTEMADKRAARALLGAALLVLAVVAQMLLGPEARADTLRPGYMELTETTPQNWDLVWKAPMKTGIKPETMPVLPLGCNAKAKPVREMLAGAVLTRMKFACEASIAGKQIGLSNFSSSRTDVLVRIQPIEGTPEALRLTANAPAAQISLGDARWNGRGQIFTTYLTIGTEHIIFGYDHLLFVIALVLLVQGWRRIAWAITAFTLSHSLTLVATSLGFIGLPQRPVEALIALSILFLAVEIVKRDPDRPSLTERYPWVVAFGFGLLHGFGFAGALREIGLPEQDVGTALLGFNFGVEIGQLVIVGLTLAAMYAVHRFLHPYYQRVIRISAYAIGIVASAWLFERTVL